MSNWWICQPLVMEIYKTICSVNGLITRLKVLEKSISGLWWKPLATNRALYRCTKPSLLCLSLKTHLFQIIFKCGWDRTRVQVWFFRIAWNLSFKAVSQGGDCKASWTERGSSFEGSWVEERNKFFLKIPCWDWLTIGWENFNFLTSRSTTSWRLGVELGRSRRLATWLGEAGR